LALALSLKARALKYLSARDHSRHELSRKLSRYCEDADEISNLLNDFEKKGWLSEQRFVQSVVHRQAEKFGSRRIAQTLAQHQVPKDLARTELARVQHTELERAMQVWQKKFGTPPQTPQERIRQMRFLILRGFAPETIQTLLKHAQQQGQ
jgi:regulatory protein